MEDMTNIKTSNPLEDLRKKLEEKRKTKVILLTMDESRNIDKYLVSQVYNMMESLAKETTLTDIDVIIHSWGGDADAAYHIGKILRSYCSGKLTFIVPRLAKSAAALLCCAGDAIIMGKPSELGPVDPQIIDPFRGVRYSALSIKDTMLFLDKIEKECSENEEECNKVIKESIRNLPLMEIGDNLRALNHIADYLHELLITRMFKEEYKNEKKKTETYINNIVSNLIQAHYSHGKCIDKDTAKIMGLKIENISKEEWNIVWDIFKIFEKEVLIK